MGTPYSDKFNEDQKQISTLTFQARQMLCCARADDEGMAQIPIAALEKYEEIVCKAEDYLQGVKAALASSALQITDADAPQTEMLDDGFGNFMPVICPDCLEASVQVVRPGKFQCVNDCW